MSAVRQFDMGMPAIKAVEGFRSFEELDRRSSLVKFYLSFALSASQKPDDKKQYDEADLYLREALASPDVDQSAMTWFRDHHKFETYLVDFAKSRMLRADLVAEKYDVESPVKRAKDEEVKDEERDRELRQPTYQLAMDALHLAEKLNPGSLETQRLLATTEKYFDRFGPAYERISRVIDWIKTGTNNDMLFHSREMRGWLARAWAEKEHETGTVNRETLARLLIAADDFDYCAQFLEKRNFGENQARAKFYVMQHRLRAAVTLAEVELWT